MKGNLTTRPISVVCVNVVLHLSNSYTRLALPCFYNNCKQSTHPVPVIIHNNTRLRLSWTNSLPSLELVHFFTETRELCISLEVVDPLYGYYVRNQSVDDRKRTALSELFFKFAYKRLLGSTTRERLRVGNFFNREIKHRVYGKQQT